MEYYKKSMVAVKFFITFVILLSIYMTFFNDKVMSSMDKNAKEQQEQENQQILLQKLMEKKEFEQQQYLEGQRQGSMGPQENLQAQGDSPEEMIYNVQQELNQSAYQNEQQVVAPPNYEEIKTEQPQQTIIEEVPQTQPEIPQEVLRPEENMNPQMILQTN